jgi:hypothetical protein
MDSCYQKVGRRINHTTREKQDRTQQPHTDPSSDVKCPITVKLSLVKAGCQYCCNSISPTSYKSAWEQRGSRERGQAMRAAFILPIIYIGTTTSYFEIGHVGKENRAAANAGKVTDAMSHD